VPKRRRRSNAGRREDLGIYVRSTWEANVARLLILLQKNGDIYSWRYEPRDKEFEFPVKRGSKFYLPDFEVIEKEGDDPIFWEVKGFMDQKSRTKLKRMQKYFPDIKIVLIDKKAYRSLSKWKSLVENWE
jgi:hypothetical protein